MSEEERKPVDRDLAQRRMAGKPLVVIVTGAPATGKTTLGRRVAEVCRLPFLHKDGIKERLFDRLGWGERAWSQKLGHAATEVLFYLVEVQLQAGRSLVVESNFEPRFHTDRFLKLLTRFPYDPIQILCTAEATTLAQRYEVRARSGERHPGHLDGTLARELDVEERLQRHRALELGGRVIVVDTTHFEHVDFDGVTRVVSEALAYDDPLFERGVRCR